MIIILASGLFTRHAQPEYGDAYYLKSSEICRLHLTCCILDHLCLLILQKSARMSVWQSVGWLPLSEKFKNPPIAQILAVLLWSAVPLRLYTVQAADWQY